MVFKRQKNITGESDEINIFDDEELQMNRNKKQRIFISSLRKSLKTKNKEKRSFSYLNRLSFDVNISDDEISTEKKILTKCVSSLKLNANVNQYHVKQTTTGWNSCSSGFSDNLAPAISKIKTKPMKQDAVDTIDIEWKQSQSDDENVEPEILSQEIDESSQFESNIILETPESTPQKIELETGLQSSSTSNCDSKSNARTDLIKDFNQTGSPLQLKNFTSGSNWLQQIPWQSKTPEKKSELPKNLFDSGKKKKPIDGGFVEQLLKVTARQKSSQNMWRHQMLNKQDKGIRKFMTLNVLNMKNDKGLNHAWCHVLNQDTKNETKSFEFCNLLINNDINTRFKIIPGTFIRIHAPWQKLKNAIGVPTILSFYYCEIIKLEINVITDLPIKEVFFRWICPCQTSEMSVKLCPLMAETGIVLIEPTSQQIETDIGVNNQSISKCVERVIESPVLHTVKSETPNASQNNSNEIENFILKAVENAGGQNGQKRPLKINGIVENITEVFNSLSKIKTKWQILLKDKDQIYCIIDLPTISIDDPYDCWSQLVRSGVGQLYSFCGLSIIERLTSDKNQTLFRMINEKCSKTYSQSFCYVLKCLRGDSTCYELKQS